MLWVLLLLLGCREQLGPPPGRLAPRAPVAWNATLLRVVDAEGDVDYAALRDERAALDEYLRWIARPAAIDGRTGPQLHAFWLNSFNALVLYQVLERDVQQSTLEVPSALPWEGARFWAGTELVVAGEPLTLWEVGHERLTHLQQDYRDFAALSVAARSGPPLRAGLFNARDLEGQLDQQARKFFGSERAVRIEPDGTLSFNPLFDRYEPELRMYTGQRDPCAITAHFATGARRQALAKASAAGCPHEVFDFDWSLNQAGVE